MLPRKLHLEQINRFHDKLEDLSKSIENEDNQDIKNKLSFEYYLLTKIWFDLDNTIEDLKDKLDLL